jgi:hypothetical protein
MKKTVAASNAMPSAHIAVNKSRLKVYKNVGSLPTYYLQKGQEFQIELFNPTQDVIMAKISLNSKVISQGGLVLNPGQRVFLDRYLDIAKKFMFDTYEVSANNEEVKKAIENNGDFKVEFYREKTAVQVYSNPITWINTGGGYGYGTLTGSLGNYTTGTDPQFLKGSTTTNTSNSVSHDVSSNSDMSFMDSSYERSAIELDSLVDDSVSSSKKSKTIETGRVEKGSNSDQEFTYVNKSFEYFSFHTLEYKLLPISQKVNTVEDINVKRYCTQCGKKQGSGDNFCAGCGKKQ